MKVLVLGRRIPVRSVSAKELKSLSNDPECIGFFDGSSILLKDTLKSAQAKRVLLHEIIHAIFAVSGLTNILEDKTEEAVCDALESLVEVIQDQEVRKFLT